MRYTQEKDLDFTLQECNFIGKGEMHALKLVDGWYNLIKR
jgi:hypothetical protein